MLSLPHTLPHCLPSPPPVPPRLPLTCPGCPHGTAPPCPVHAGGGAELGPLAWGCRISPSPPWQPPSAVRCSAGGRAATGSPVLGSPQVPPGPQFPPRHSSASTRPVNTTREQLVMLIRSPGSKAAPAARPDAACNPPAPGSTAKAPPAAPKAALPWPSVCAASPPPEPPMARSSRGSHTRPWHSEGCAGVQALAQAVGSATHG